MLSWTFAEPLLKTVQTIGGQKFRLVAHNRFYNVISGLQEPGTNFNLKEVYRIQYLSIYLYNSLYFQLKMLKTNNKYVS